MRKVLMSISVVMPLLLGSCRTAQPSEHTTSSAAVSASVSGSGTRNIVLVPGLAGGSLTWRETANHLGGRYRVHEIDIAGLGEASPGPKSIDELADAVASYINVAADAPVVVVGHSAGGSAMLALALRHPELVSHVVVVDALPFMSQDQKTNGLSEALVARIRHESSKMLSESNAEFTERLTRELRSSVGSNALARQIAFEAARSDRRTYVALRSNMMLLDARESIRGLSVPLTVIFADQKPNGAPASFMRTRFEQQFESAPSSFKEVSDARHFLMLDQPERFLVALDSALHETTEDRSKSKDAN